MSPLRTMVEQIRLHLSQRLKFPKSHTNSGLMQTQSLGSSLPWTALHCPTGHEEQGKPV